MGQFGERGPEASAQRDRSEIDKQSARKKEGSATRNRTRGFQARRPRRANPRLLSFRHVHTRGFGIVALIKPVRVTSHEW